MEPSGEYSLSPLARTFCALEKYYHQPDPTCFRQARVQVILFPNQSGGRGSAEHPLPLSSLHSPRLAAAVSVFCLCSRCPECVVFRETPEKGWCNYVFMRPVAGACVNYLSALYPNGSREPLLPNRPAINLGAQQKKTLRNAFGLPPPSPP